MSGGIEPAELLDRWQGDELRLRSLGLHQAADQAACYRSELAAWWRERLLDELTLEEAAHYSGYSYGTLSNKIRAGELHNVGRKNAPRIRRCDLPAKAPGPPSGGAEVIDLAERILRSS
jgi:hypothetical protein